MLHALRMCLLKSIVYDLHTRLCVQYYALVKITKQLVQFFKVTIIDYYLDKFSQLQKMIAISFHAQ